MVAKPAQDGLGGAGVKLLMRNGGEQRVIRFLKVGLAQFDWPGAPDEGAESGVNSGEMGGGGHGASSRAQTTIGRKNFFFEKKKQKTFDCFPPGDFATSRAKIRERFYGAFYK
jgi:hypothetical protein